MLKAALIKHYLEKYSEIEAQVLQNKSYLFFGGVFEYALVVPVYNDSHAFEKLMSSVVSAAKASKQSILVIAVVNCRVNSPTSVSRCNLELLSTWSAKLGETWSVSKGVRFLGGYWNQLGVLIVDRTSLAYRFKEKQGVGLARKIGSDIATALYEKKHIRRDLIFNTDCDAILPNDFFTKEVSSRGGKYALLTPFRYSLDQCVDLPHKRAAIYYKQYLEYYVSGLRFAKSPYAFFTIGSTISFSVEAYASVRGFSKSKLAGEDFYLLNKLAKVGKVRTRESDLIILEARFSDRVPFGTGRSIQQIRSDVLARKDAGVYHPDCFYLLFVWLYVVEKFLTFEDVNIKSEMRDAMTVLAVYRYGRSSKLDNIIRVDFLDFLIKLNYIDALNRVMTSSKNKATTVKNFHIWFDSFRTLKFIHQVRDRFCGSVTYSDLNNLHAFDVI